MHENAQAIVKSSIFPGFDSDQCFHFHWSFNVIFSALKSAKKCIFYYCLVSIISLGFFKFSIALFSDSFTRALCTLICFISFLLLLFTIYKHDFFWNWWLYVTGCDVTSQKKSYTTFIDQKSFNFWWVFLKFDIWYDKSLFWPFNS